MATTSHSRAAAWAAAAILAAIAGLQVYWGLGGTWALPEGQGGATSSTAEDVGSVAVGLLALAAAGVLLVRVGYWRGRVPPSVVRLAWTFALVALGGALAQFAAWGFLAGAVDLVVAVLAFVVARSDLPASPAGGRALPSGNPGPPAPTH